VKYFNKIKLVVININKKENAKIYKKYCKTNGPVGELYCIFVTGWVSVG
tara:strand:- start:517 stop:663 length:147 start_codon:yes stop_codon:yes gene_type:complete